ncbi:MAG: hypothetical protein LH472_01705 [Pyrinomonadaceae bacterium]|nr:hypothetical protein [Pyrinomonadaceae bacterium]
MNKLKLLTIVSLSAAIGLAAACSPAANTATSNTTGANTPAANTNTTTVANTTAPKTADETPASVKAAFPDAQSFTTQHKDLTKAQITEIENNSGGKITDTDHHSYLAFSTAGGTRKQIGAATVVKVNGKDVVVVYENKNGSPFINEVRSEGVPAAFLAQFKGKGHDDVVTFDEKIKPNGADAAMAEAMIAAIGADALAMQTLYGAAHSH